MTTDRERLVRVVPSIDRMPVGTEGGSEVAIERGQLTVRGDNSGAVRRLVHVGAETVTLATGWQELSNAVGQQFEFSPDSAAMLLRLGFVPVPHTLFANVFQAGIGDTLSIDLRSGMVAHTCDFPFLIAKSRQSETWSPEVFTDLLCASCERTVPEHAGLLLSAGKDSTALLLALQRIGRKDVLCVTYDAGYREQEAALASVFAREMGFSHVTVPADPKREFEIFVSFLRSTPHLTLDFSLPAVLVAVTVCAEYGTAALDGSGNDKYMHYSTSRRERLLRGVSLPSRFGGLGWGLDWPGLGQRAAYVASSATMYAAERWFPGTRLSGALIRELTGSAKAAEAFARSLDLSLRGCHVIDAATVAKARYSGHCSAMEKTRVAAECSGARAIFPFCDHALIDYYFNLPNALRFDARTFETKIAFKQWLHQQPINSEYFRAKGSFRYDMSAMFKHNFGRIADMMTHSKNIEFTPRLRRLFEAAGTDYFRAQQAYLIFSLVTWADFHGYRLNRHSRS